MKKIFFLLGFLACMVAVNSPVAKAAFGISPPWVKNDHLLPGSSFTETITLSTNSPAQDMIVHAEVTGDKNLKKWVTIENLDALVMKKGQTQLPMQVKVEVPKRAGLEDYKGNIEISLEPLVKSNAGGVSIALGANAEIRLKVVGDKVVDYKISSASTQEITEGESMNLQMNVENLGNASLDAITVEAEIWSQNEQEMITKVNADKLDMPLEAYETGQVSLKIPLPKLAPGNYWVKIKAYKEKTLVFESKVFLPIKGIPMPEVKPKFPTKMDEMVAPGETAPSEAITPEADLHGAAPALQGAQQALGNNYLLFLAIGGMAFGAIAMIVMAIVLIMVLKKQMGSAPKQNQ